MKAFTLPKPFGFRLAAASEFYSGFTPGSGLAATAGDALSLAFRLDQSFAAVAVRLREAADSISAEMVGSADAARAKDQIARMLGLRADGEAWRRIGEKVPEVGALQAEFPGFFTAAKPSPYDAAVWAIIAPRMNMRQAADIKTRLAREHGERVEIGGQHLEVFPAPAQLLAIDAFPGLSAEKINRLRGVAEAALAGKLEAARLLAMDEAEALAELQELRGVGPWAASHIYYRGAAPIDALPTAEPRVLHGFGHAFGIAAPTIDAFRAAAESWRPFRMWVCILLSRHLASTGGWKAPSLRAERAAAGRELGRTIRQRR